MARFGGNEFTSFSVPLVFDGRYFILEPGNPPLITVVSSQGGQPRFEVLKNQPVTDDVSEVTSTPPGIVTVSDRASGRFLYKVRPGSETSVIFGQLDGGELQVRITDRRIQIGGTVLENNTFSGTMAGVVVRPDGGMSIGAPIPPEVRAWFQ